MDRLGTTGVIALSPVIVLTVKLHFSLSVIHGGKYCDKVPVTPVQRVILHFDLDCFYAQVEMIRNPALRNVPLGDLFYILFLFCLLFFVSKRFTVSFFNMLMEALVA